MIWRGFVLQAVKDPISARGFASPRNGWALKYMVAASKDAFVGSHRTVTAGVTISKGKQLDRPFYAV
jgi:hypothetical protein